MNLLRRLFPAKVLPTKHWKCSVCVYKDRAYVQIVGHDRNEVPWPTGEIIECPLEVDHLTAEIERARRRGSPKVKGPSGYCPPPAMKHLGFTSTRQMAKAGVLAAYFGDSYNNKSSLTFSNENGPTIGHHAPESAIDHASPILPREIAEAIVSEWRRRNPTSALSEARLPPEEPEFPSGVGWFLLPAGKVKESDLLVSPRSADAVEVISRCLADDRVTGLIRSRSGWAQVIGHSVAGNGTPEDFRKTLNTLSNLSETYGVAVAGASQRTVGYAHWALASGGKIERALFFLGESGERFEVGEPTPVESELDPELLEIPDEDALHAVLGAWMQRVVHNRETVDQTKAWLGRWNPGR